MERNNYRCNKCNTEFHALPYQTNCTNLNCGSDDTEPIATNIFSNLIDFLKKNWRITLPIIGVIILILLLRGCDGCNKLNVDYKEVPWLGDIIINPNQPPNANYIEFTITRKLEKEEDEYTKDKNQPIIDKYNGLVKIYHARSNRQVAFEKNRIYLCEEDANKEISLEFRFINDNKKQKFITEIVKLILNDGLTASPKAICGVPDLQGEDITITPIGNCKIEVKLGKSFPGKTAMISVEGRGGDFSTTTIYDVSGIQKKNYDVWVYLEGQGVDSIILPPVKSSNAELVTNKGCINPKELEKTRIAYQKEFTILLKSYLNNSDPNNLILGDKARDYFMEKFRGKGNVLLMDGKKCIDWPDLENLIVDVQQSLTKNEGLKLNKVEVSKDCNTVTISISSN